MRLRDHWFYAAPGQVGSWQFDAEETRHAVKALRLSAGEMIQWVDGRGGRYRGTVTQIGQVSFEATVLATLDSEQSLPLHLGIGQLHDAARMEWLIEKGTELGVTSFSLLETARTERSRYRMSRLEAKALAAMKQSGRATLPTIAEMPLVEFLHRADAASQRFIAHCYTLGSGEHLPSELTTAGADLLIGPEGDFTEQEVEQAMAAAYRSITLGNARLRSETAALKAISIVTSR